MLKTVSVKQGLGYKLIFRTSRTMLIQNLEWNLNAGTVFKLLQNLTLTVTVDLILFKKSPKLIIRAFFRSGNRSAFSCQAAASAWLSGHRIGLTANRRSSSATLFPRLINVGTCSVQCWRTAVTWSRSLSAFAKRYN